MNCDTCKCLKCDGNHCCYCGSCDEDRAKLIGTWWTRADNYNPGPYMKAVKDWDRFGKDGELPWGDGDEL